MKHATPFKAAELFAHALAAIASAYRPGSVAYGTAVNALGPYKGRGKGRTRNHDRGGSRAYQRAAVKARNTKRFRRANA